MTVQDRLEQLYKLAKRDAALRERLLSTRKTEYPIREFCNIASEAGVELGVMELVSAGEEAYAAMRRSTNGGGENSPKLQWEDDLYEMFLIELE